MHRWYVFSWVCPLWNFFWMGLCISLQSVTKCAKTKRSIFYCTVQNALMQRRRDDAFVSHAYADVCPCATTVTSHNPEKLHQSHLIMYIHDAAFFFVVLFLIFFLLLFIFFGSHVSGTCHRAVGRGWVKRVSISWFTTSLTMQHHAIFHFFYLDWEHRGVFCYFKDLSSCLEITSASSMSNPGGNF